MNPFDLSGRVAVVTGANTGIGQAIAIALAQAGADVALVGRTPAEDTAHAIRDLGRRALIVSADLSSIEPVQRIVDETVAGLGGLDILVNNAGITHLPKPMDTVTEEEFDRVYAVNMKSVYLTAQALVPGMKARGRGAILNVASTAGLSPRPRLSWYNASKGWMITATKAMAVELAPEGVRVNAICPVAGETPLLKSFMGEDTPETRAKFLATIPIGRFSTPQDMGNTACFLCSDEAGMITGTALEVDGGRCI